MKQIFTLLTGACLLLSYKANTQLVLNELYTDPGSGSHEFFELYNTNPSSTPISADNFTLVTFFDISGQKGFYVMDLPDINIASRGYFVGSASIPYNYQGQTNSTASDFNWNGPTLTINNGYIKKWVQGTANLTDGNSSYDQAILPADFNDFFFRRTGSGASYSVFLYKNGQIINTFIGGTGGSSTVLTVIVNMPPLYIDMTAASPDFTISFTGYGSLPVESCTQEAGSDNGYIREMDGACASWDKSSSSKQHTPKATNGMLTGTNGSVAVAVAISRGTAATGSTVNYNVVGAPSAYFPIELQVYTDLGSIFGRLDALDTYVESNTETVISQGPFYTNFFPHTANILIAVKTSAGCLDKILFIPNAFVLSVKLISFEGSQVNNDIKLSWQADFNETANRYEVEMSTNGRDFTTAGIVLATEKTGSEKYSFTSPVPVSGKIIYRLRIFNKNGKVDYSNVLVFQNKEESKRALTIFNNPVVDKLTFSFQATISQAMDIKILNMSGALVLQQKISSSKGTNVVSIPASSNLKSGAYIIDLFDGINHYPGKFIKQ